MIANMITGVTRVLGKAQGYFGLPIRDEMRTDGVPQMVSSWTPTPAEIEALNAGAPVLLSVLGTSHPPVLVYVGEKPE